ncbi:MAG: hypothetical protein M0Z30_10735 [Actinomycetota bacterium]|nr:hypothetical protein [Actinomycetota bacterium]
MAKVVKVDPLEAELAEGLVPCGVKRRSSEALRQRAGEHQLGRLVGGHVAVEVLAQRGAHRGGEVDGALTGVGLGRSGEPLALLQLDGLAHDVDQVAVEVEVASLQTEQLAEAEATEPGQEDHGAVALLDGGGDA